MNDCAFSPCRKYRYSLEHNFAPLLPVSRVMWIGLNPSTADEAQLDPTLRRVCAFSAAWGFTSFVMTNLFAFRTKDPEVMKTAVDPVGVDNDATLLRLARECDAVVACWGTHGAYRYRSAAVRELLASVRGRVVECLGTNADSSPKHPLYVPASAPRQLFQTL